MFGGNAFAWPYFGEAYAGTVSTSGVTITLTGSGALVLQSDGASLGVNVASGAFALHADSAEFWPVTTTPAEVDLKGDAPSVPTAQQPGSGVLSLAGDAPSTSTDTTPTLSGAFKLAAGNPNIIGAAQTSAGVLRLTADALTVYPITLTPGTVSLKGDALALSVPVPAVSGRLLLTSGPPQNVFPLQLSSSGILKLLAAAPAIADFSLILEASGILRLRSDTPVVTPLTEPPPPPPPPPPGSGVSIAVTV